jgi:hypothetical protein
MSERRRPLALLALIALLGASTSVASVSEASPSAIREVKVSRAFFNPSLQQTVAISFRIIRPGSLDLRILDRDGFVVRTLARDHFATPGAISFSWDGCDDGGIVLPDEAYSLKIDLTSKTGSESYFPASSPARDVKAELGYYDRRTAVLSYRLSAASRVHIQAGLARTDEKTGERTGPVLKTIVNREPRPAGADIETWNGLDETGSYFVPDLPGFVMAIAASSLPENSIITVGNTSQEFVEWALDRKGDSLLKSTTVNQSHHKGLAVFDDLSPSLALQPSNARKTQKGNVWTVDGESLRGSLSLEGPTRTQFARQPGSLLVFLDDRRVLVEGSPTDGMMFEVPLSGLSPGEHIVAFDWVSEYGPVAVTSLLIDVPEKPSRVANKAGSPK